jgi:NTP pyrophosphatase (non-canonical NTP hydrolase)
MHFYEYQEATAITARYPDVERGGTEKARDYVLIALAGEVGELLNKYKKLLRDGPCMTDQERYELLDGIALEYGDILWYVSQGTTEFGLSLEGVANRNIEKLARRKEHDTIKGSGDHR